MKFSIAFVACLIVTPAMGQDCPLTWKCPKIESAPSLDADLSEWDTIQGLETALHMPITDALYEPGPVSTKCAYDDTNIYFALEIPGSYRFSADDNKLCASIATMMKIGADATYVDMGGCPEASTEDSTCNDTVLEACDAHRVDIGAHWELATTEQGVTYPVEQVTPAQRQDPGNDLVANLDDEYSVGPYCRNDDDDPDAGNEWGGSWKHTNPVEGEMGTYIFELSRTLKTPSLKTDGQMEAGETYEFGIAFWDPYETEVDGWTDAGHYVTGCSKDWIEMELVASDGGGETTTSAAAPTGLSRIVVSNLRAATAASCMVLAVVL